VQECGLDLGLLELVRLRISQINGCAFCVNMHIPLERKHGLSENQTNLVATWKEAPVFSEQERAALAYAEALTVIRDQDISDEVYQPLTKHFSDEQIANLTLCIAEINSWNRLMLASRTPPQL